MHDPMDPDIDPVLRDAFKATARPSPSPFFDARLRAALADERRRQRGIRARLRIMQVYWGVSSLITLAILSVLAWRTPPQTVWIPLILVAALVALPAALLRVDPIDLMAGSVRHLRTPR